MLNKKDNKKDRKMLRNSNRSKVLRVNKRNKRLTSA